MADSVFHKDFKSMPWWWEWWHPNTELSQDPPRKCDVLVVGAGYGGLSTALELARSGVEVTVLERGAFGDGASTRNGGGVSGGDVALVDKGMFYQINGQAPPAPAPQDLVVKRGQWILLARSSAVGPIYKWYKITEADPDETGGATSAELLGSAPPPGFPIRHVTLFGQDWTFDANNQTFAYILPGVVSVYEKTIRLENSSLWSQ